MKRKAIEWQQHVGAFVQAFLWRENAEESFEYMLVMAAVVLVVVVALIVGFETLVPKVVGHTCPSIDTGISPASANGACVTSS